MNILKTVNAVQLISGKPQGKPTPHDASSLAALFGGSLKGSTELSIHLAAGDVLALKVTQHDLAGIKSALGSNGGINDGIDFYLSTTPGEFGSNKAAGAGSPDRNFGEIVTLLPTTSAKFASDFYINLKRHDGKAGDIILQLHG